MKHIKLLSLIGLVLSLCLLCYAFAHYQDFKDEAPFVLVGLLFAAYTMASFHYYAITNKTN